jgi:hypothetical protein
VTAAWSWSVQAGIRSKSNINSSRSATNQLTSDQLGPGDCLAGSGLGLGTDSPWPEYVTSVACTKQHVAEVFFAGNIWPRSLAFPGENAITSQAHARCTAEFTAYDGINYPQSAFTFDTITPSDSTWTSVPGSWCASHTCLLMLARPAGHRWPIRSRAVIGNARRSIDVLVSRPNAQSIRHHVRRMRN